MVTELGKYLGYQSYKDRQLFKEQVKAELGGESIAEMTEYDQIRIKIEELHQWAGTHHNFIFATDDPGLFKEGTRPS